MRSRPQVSSIRRRFRNEGVFCVRGKVNYMRSYVRPDDPKNWRQVDQRQNFGGSQSAWKNLTAGERDGWSDYGRR